MEDLLFGAPVALEEPPVLHIEAKGEVTVQDNITVTDGAGEQWHMPEKRPATARRRAPLIVGAKELELSKEEFKRLQDIQKHAQTVAASDADADTRAKAALVAHELKQFVETPKTVTGNVLLEMKEKAKKYLGVLSGKVETSEVPEAINAVPEPQTETSGAQEAPAKQLSSDDSQEKVLNIHFKPYVEICDAYARYVSKEEADEFLLSILPEGEEFTPVMLQAVAIELQNRKENEEAQMREIREKWGIKEEFSITDEDSADWFGNKLQVIEHEIEDRTTQYKAKIAELERDYKKLFKHYEGSLYCWAKDQVVYAKTGSIRKKTFILPRCTVKFETTGGTKVVDRAVLEQYMNKLTDEQLAKYKAVRKVSFDSSSVASVVEKEPELLPGMIKEPKNPIGKIKVTRTKVDNKGASDDAE